MRFLLNLLLLVPCISSGQYVFIHLNDGTSNVYDILDIISAQSIGAEFKINFVDGTAVSWALTDMHKIEHGDISTGIIEETIANGDLIVYPNPFSDLVKIEWPIWTSKVRISITDQTGRVLSAYVLDDPTADHWYWDGTDGISRKLPNGLYIIRWSDGKKDLVKTVILQY